METDTGERLRVHPQPSIQIFVVEDHPIMREGVRATLERDGDILVCGSASTVGEALLALPEARPSLILCDLHLPDAEDADAVWRLASSAGTVPIVVFSVDDAPSAVAAALRAGARGYIPKRATPEELRAAVRAAAAGLLTVHPEVGAALHRSPTAQAPQADASDRPPAPAHRPQPADAGARERLTPRELEYLRYLAEGYTNKEIARAMVLAEDTVKKGIQALTAKLGATDRTHAVVIALRQHLID